MAIAIRAPVGGRKCRRHILESVGGGGLERLLELHSLRISGYEALIGMESPISKVMFDMELVFYLT
jgi:hypothetical protein